MFNRLLIEASNFACAKRAGISELQEIEFRQPGLLLLSKDKKLMIYSTANFLLSSWIFSPVELLQLKHSFRQLAF
jgi:hypothetical protein